MPYFGQKAEMTVSLMNMDTQEELFLAGNPLDLKVALAATYTEFEVIGSSFKPMQYQGTENIQVSFTLQVIPETVDEFETAHDLEYFLYGLMYPFEPGGSPPDVLLVWPEYMVMYVKILALDVSWTHYNGYGCPDQGTIGITAKNVRTERLTQSDIRVNGLRQ